MSKLQPERKGAIAASPSPNNTEWNPTSSSPNHVTLWLYLIISTLNTCHHPFPMRVYTAKVCVLPGYSKKTFCIFCM